MKMSGRVAIVALILLSMFFTVVEAMAEEITVYTARRIELLKPVLTAYTRETGVKVRYITGEADELIKRLRSEGENTKADLLLTVDGGSLWRAAQEGLLKPSGSAELRQRVPLSFRDSHDRWFGISKRARTIVYSTERVNPRDLSTYEDLAAPRWKGRLCLRTARKVYNKSLVAMMIAQDGIEEAERVIKGWVGNLAVSPFKSDKQVMSAIKAGRCDVGLVNTYYFGRISGRQSGQNLALFWPNQDGGGVHMDISGIGVVRHASNSKGAERFILWLTGKKAQRLFADSNLEYPVNPSVKPNDKVLSWGSFNHSVVDIAKSGEFRLEAVKLMERAGYR